MPRTPREVDGVLRRAWGKAYDGNLGNMGRAATDFIAAYATYIYKGEELRYEKLRMEELREEFYHRKLKDASDRLFLSSEGELQSR